MVCACMRARVCVCMCVCVCVCVCVCCVCDPNGGEIKNRKSVKVKFILHPVLHVSTVLATHDFYFMNDFGLVGTERNHNLPSGTTTTAASPSLLSLAPTLKTKTPSALGDPTRAWLGAVLTRHVPLKTLLALPRGQRRDAYR